MRLTCPFVDPKLPRTRPRRLQLPMHLVKIVDLEREGTGFLRFVTGMGDKPEMKPVSREYDS